MYLQIPTEPRTVREAWSEHIAREVSGGDDMLAPESRREVIRAVAACCEEMSRSGPLRSELIPQLYQRAAASLGGKFVCEDGGGEVPDTEGIENLPAPVRELLATEWFRPLGGQVQGGGRNWLLEVDRFSACRGGLELRFFQEMKQTLELVAPVWQSGNGAGALALRGMRSALSGIRGRPARAGELADFILETRGYCADVLAALAPARQWDCVPAVVVRDL